MPMEVDDAQMVEGFFDETEVLDRVPYTRQHIRRLEKEGRFPKRVRLGPHRVGWLRREIRAWIEARVQERDAA